MNTVSKLFCMLLWLILLTMVNLSIANSLFKETQGQENVETKRLKLGTRVILKDSVMLKVYIDNTKVAKTSGKEGAWTAFSKFILKGGKPVVVILEFNARKLINGFGLTIWPGTDSTSSDVAILLGERRFPPLAVASPNPESDVNSSEWKIGAIEDLIASKWENKYLLMKWYSTFAGKFYMSFVLPFPENEKSNPDVMIKFKLNDHNYSFLFSNIQSSQKRLKKPK